MKRRLYAVAYGLPKTTKEVLALGNWREVVKQCSKRWGVSLAEARRILEEQDGVMVWRADPVLRAWWPVRPSVPALRLHCGVTSDLGPAWHFVSDGE